MSFSNILLVSLPFWIGLILFFFKEREIPPGGLAQYNWKPKEIFLALCYLIISKIIFVFFVFPFSDWFKSSKLHFFVFSLVSLFIPFFGVVIVYVIVVYRHQLCFKNFLFSENGGYHVALAIQWFLFICAIYIFIAHVLFGLPFYIEQNAQRFRNTSVLNFIYAVFLTVIFAPFTEELFHRGLLLVYFIRRLGKVSGIIWSSAIFSYIHFIPNSIIIKFLIEQFLVGILLSYLYFRTQSLPLVISTHGLFNLLNDSDYFVLKFYEKGINLDQYAFLIVMLALTLGAFTHYLIRTFEIFKKI